MPDAGNRPETVEEPRLGSWKLTRSGGLAYALYGLLALSALAALLSSTRAGVLPPWARSGAPIAFAGFLALFGAYRFMLVRARRYPAGKAFFQVGAGALFLMLLLPPGGKGVADPASRPLEALMADPSPTVRALACEVAGYRPEGRALAPVLAEHVADASPSVRQAALASLRRLAGADAGGEGPDAAERWRAWAQSVRAAPAP